MAFQRERSFDAEADLRGMHGRKPAPPPSPTNLLPHPPLHNFTFLSHPTGWDVVLLEEEARLVPRLRRFYYEPGIAGVEQVRGRDDGDPERALLAERKKGWNEIPRNREVVAFGQTFDDFAHVIDGHKGPVHFSVWESPYTIGPKVEIDFDTEGWHRFLVGLMDEGIVKRPTRSIEQAVRVEFETAMRRYQTSGLKSATAIACAEIYERKLGAFAVIQGGGSRGRRPEPAPTSQPGPDAGAKEPS